MDYILDHIHLGDLLELLDAINRRKRSDALLELLIIHNPYVKNPNELFRELKREVTYDTFDNGIDREGLNKLRKDLGKSKFIKVKK